MGSDEALLNICTRFVDQNYGESGENICGKCKMKDRLQPLINELKSSQLIIKILQEEIKLTSVNWRNQDNLTNCAEYKSHDESHPTIDKNSVEGNLTHKSNGYETQEVQPYRSKSFRHILSIIDSL